jgi:nucleotide-binding universal stress UspA family protein
MLEHRRPVLCAFKDTAIARHALRARRGSRTPSRRRSWSPTPSTLWASRYHPPGTWSRRRSPSKTWNGPRADGRSANSTLPPSWSAVQASSPELLEGQPIPGLLELAASRGARLIVTGTAARVGLDRILKGSVTGELAAHAPCPVIAVPRAAALEEPGPVLAGYDGSEHGLRAARHAAALAAQLNRELVVVQVDKRGDEVARSRPRARRRVVRRRLGRAAQRTRSAASPRGQRRTRNR